MIYADRRVEPLYTACHIAAPTTTTTTATADVAKARLLRVRLLLLLLLHLLRLVAVFLFLVLSSCLLPRRSLVRATNKETTK